MAVGHFHSANDGIDDLAVVSPSDKTLTVLFADGKGGFKTATAEAFGTTLASLAVGDLNQDLIDDIAVADQAGTVWILLGNGDGTFHAPNPLNAKVCQSGPKQGESCSTTANCSGKPCAAAPKGLVIADFDSANGNDLAVTDYNGSQVLLFLNDGAGAGTFTVAGHFPTPAQPGTIVAADLNGDSVLDLAVLS